MASGAGAISEDPVEAMIGHRVHGILLTKVLALGTFGAVYVAERPGDRALFAVKCLFKTGLRAEHVDQQHAEIAVNQQLGRHPNVVALTDTLETDEHLFLVFEYAARGDLYGLIKHDPHGIYDKDFARALFDQIALGVQHCHDRGVFHRDLKPENILLTDDWVVKIADFGLATTTRTPHDFGCGSPPYMAPEVVDRTGTTYDAAAADVWSLGIILFNMLFGVNPWEKAAANDRHFKHYLQAPAEFFGARFEMAPAVQQVLVRVLEPEPRRRLSLAQLRQQVALLDLADLYPAPRLYSSSPAVSMKSHALTTRPIVVGATQAARNGAHGGLAPAAHAPVPAFLGTSPAARSHTSTASPLSMIVGSWADEVDSMDFSAPVVFSDGSPSPPDMPPHLHDERPTTGPSSSPPGPPRSRRSPNAPRAPKPPRVPAKAAPVPAAAIDGDSQRDRSVSPDIFDFEQDEAPARPKPSLAGAMGSLNMGARRRGGSMTDESTTARAPPTSKKEIARAPPASARSSAVLVAGSQ